MNKLATFTFVLSALALNASFAHADDTRIGVVDMQKAIQSSADGKKAKSELETAFNKKKKELDDQGAALKKEQEDFQKKQAALSDTAKREKGSKLQEKMMKYQELLQKSNVEIQKKEQEMSEPIIRKIREKVSEIAKKKNLSIVLEKNDNIVIYSEDKNDITSDVISAIN
jgi:outer membrane protein